ncbi:uncharacterized protein LOC129923976 [Biomphalaria glabrata]|uniref:Uncharacterized protein LOC129923976 n=1 Tax=Biomphalaria glabrata TaxID=6526 RepID=A0A9W2ZET5_BIOGL|nr:uncharacterized protein LOC129923976 [Biomphalaria glabrata]
MISFALSVFVGFIVFGEEFPFSDIFHKISKSNYTLWTNRTAIKVRSRMDCASRCLITNRCRAFTFEETTSMCTLGFCSQSNSSARSQSVDLYQIQRKKCNTYPGFSSKSYGSTIACVWQSTERLNFTMARSDCAAKGASLFTVNTFEKLQIAGLLPGSYLIGLNDNETEKTFVFEVDNSILDESLKQQLFASGQPDDLYSDEDCVVYVDYFRGLNDISCSRNEIYVCEQFCFIP